MKRTFAGNADMPHSAPTFVLVESANAMSIVERYHSQLCQAYFVIKKEVPEIDKDYALQLAVKAISDSIGPDGLVPRLVDSGAIL